MARIIGAWAGRHPGPVRLAHHHAMPAAAAPKRGPRVDDCIERAAPFAQPLLKQMRSRFHAAHPAMEVR
jgi:hypothetical protein